MPGYVEMKSPTTSRRDDSTQKFIGPEQSLGDSMQDINNKIKWWVDNQHLVR
jgi:hypothetical protein